MLIDISLITPQIFVWKLVITQVIRKWLVNNTNLTMCSIRSNSLVLDQPIVVWILISFFYFTLCPLVHGFQFTYVVRCKRFLWIFLPSSVSKYLLLTPKYKTEIYINWNDHERYIICNMCQEVVQNRTFFLFYVFLYLSHTENVGLYDNMIVGSFDHIDLVTKVYYLVTFTSSFPRHNVFRVTPSFCDWTNNPSSPKLKLQVTSQYGVSVR